MAMLNNWPLVPDLYARAAVTVLRKDFNRIPIEALDAALFWYKAAADLAPWNSYYMACIARLEDERDLALHSDASSDAVVCPPILPASCPSAPFHPRNFLDKRSQASLASTGPDEYGQVLSPSQRQFVGLESDKSSNSTPPPALPPMRPKASRKLRFLNGSFPVLMSCCFIDRRASTAAVSYGADCSNGTRTMAAA